MARRLRLQYHGARYHVINRGNYRRDVFGSVGAAKAFETALGEACLRHEWRVHAYVIMRNHFHLALETPQPNLVEGMHWLLSTFATRFNRYRSERGHLFQGRYQSLLVEDAAALVQLIDYLHLNPVEAGIVPAAEVAAFRWSSLPRFVKGSRPSWLAPTDFLRQLGLTDTAEGWSRYVTRLVALASETSDTAGKEKEFSMGWAIGSHGWRRAVAKAHSHLATSAGIEKAELFEIKEARWQNVLQAALDELGRNEIDINLDPKGIPWKVAVADRLRRHAGAPHHWIARALNMGSPSSVRVYLSRKK